MQAKRYFLLAIIVLFTSTLFGQNIKNKDFSLFSYELSISKDLVEELSDLESFVDGIKTYNDPGNEKLKAIFVHTLFYSLKDNLQNELELEILPVNSFMREVKYDDFGYPKTNIREALKKGFSRFYFKVEVEFESLTKDKREENAELFEDIDYKVTYPQINISITVYNNQGVIPVAKWNSSSTAKYPLAINNYLLKGFDNTEMIILPAEEQQTDNIYLILDRAIHNTIQDYYNK
jgi:hypothetical protein